MLKLAIPLVLGCMATASWAEDIWLTIPQPPEMPEATSTGLADVNGIKMHYATYGKADDTPILLIHGGLAHGDIWAAQVADLSKDHTVIVADTRGHGRSSNDGSDYSYDLLAQDYLALLDLLEVDQVHLVGWSDGANIGYTISSSAPDRLASHFAHAGNVTLDGIDPTVENNEVFGAYVGMMAEDYSKMSPAPDGFDAFLGGVVAMWGTEKPGGMEALKSITVPTLVVQSERDEAILTDHSKAIADAIPEANLLILDGVSHFASFQEPEMYTQAIRSFIDQ
ncbi:alpha/beta fold hydrolase [Rhodobacteraceae bacterium B1Z28]|uniref:Alpha/beta fold hydrolase n=1 Tax=Ruegeria haliotis TaxID=2747601 RepID=A0ABX2PN86_9RHOB|nr:alpha/beta hydrolase [Ruegeria haliotis]NVO55600.1 alpha/beta fold hydrolase [Ruegeria haliotis]